VHSVVSYRAETTIVFLNYVVSSGHRGIGLRPSILYVYVYV